MKRVVLLSITFLISKAHCQLYGPGQFYPGSCPIDPGPCGPCGSDIYGPFGPCNDPYGNLVPVMPNICPTSRITPCIQNLPTPISNQIAPCANLINQPILTNSVPCPQPLFSNVPQLCPSIISNPPCTPTTPVIATTIIDNTLANSLANAIQLLIVSNLVENTLGSSCSCGGNKLAQALGILEGPCINNYEVVSPDFFPTCQFITCECPVIESCNPFINEISCYQEPVVFPCPCNSPCSQFGSGFGPVLGGLCECNSFGCDNNCVNPTCTYETCSNPFVSPIVPSCGYIEPIVAPMAVEVPIPASIPAQMICNLGYIPPNIPCVSVNVEPLPYERFNSMFGNFANYIC